MPAEARTQQTEPRSICFFVAGIPCPQGSKTAIVRDGQARLIEGRRGPARKQFAAWRAAVRTEADGRVWWPPIERGRAVAVEYTFFLPRPKTLPRGRWVPSVRPDLDKLERAVGDALTGVLYEDDSQIVRATTAKRYVHELGDPGVLITVTELEEPAA